MSASIRVLTSFVIALPLGFLAIAIGVEGAFGLVFIAALLGLLYGWIWLWWRPSGFEVLPNALVIHFPLRRRSTPRSELVSTEHFARGAELREHLGFAVRIGAGGLFGGFGWLWTRNLGLVEFYVSRTDDLVLIERQGKRPLLVTPERTSEFCDALALPTSARR